MVQLFLGILLSLLPKRYRDRLPASAQADLRMGAIVSGLAAAVVCLGFLIGRYLSFLQYRVGDLGQRAIERGHEGVLTSEVVHFGMGAVAAGEYLLQPLTVALIYFALEGTARFMAALVTQQITGTLPLYLLAWIEERFSQARAERALGPRVPDIFEEVYSNEYDARIFTCRRRPTWDRMMTIAWKHLFYEVLGEQPGKAPHHFIYRLRTSPKGRTVRTVHQFDPDELMKQKPARPGFLAWLGGLAQDKLAEIRAERQPPLPDIIDTIYGKDYHLKIASQGPKEGWNHLITIEYMNTRYEILKQVGGTPTYPYVYLLRELPPGKIIRTIQHYEPEEPSGPTSS
ncbi:MAG: hypothetical protein HY508_05130 [Acidobacteria bacterium]|nr:hypothetical protein [Acidobacteriota bacterium]